jgi:beta-glucosidase
MRQLLPPIALLLIVAAPATARVGAEPYRDAGLGVEARAQDLLARMPPEEKCWQLYLHPGDSTAGAGAGRYGLQLRTTGTTRDAARQVNAVQRRFVEGTRLGIPIIPVAEALHGVAEPGAPVLNLASDGRSRRPASSPPRNTSGPASGTVGATAIRLSGASASG